MKVTILRTNGTREEHELDPKTVFTEIERLISAQILDTVNLGRGQVMLVDDLGYETRTERHGNEIRLVATRARKPVNAEATKLYLGICKPGTTHQIVGDVAVLNELDLPEEEADDFGDEILGGDGPQDKFPNPHNL